MLVGLGVPRARDCTIRSLGMAARDVGIGK
jgi:hypothetical protein